VRHHWCCWFSRPSGFGRQGERRPADRECSGRARRRRCRTSTPAPGEHARLLAIGEKNVVIDGDLVLGPRWRSSPFLETRRPDRQDRVRQAEGRQAPDRPIPLELSSAPDSRRFQVRPERLPAKTLAEATKPRQTRPTRRSKRCKRPCPAARRRAIQAAGVRDLRRCNKDSCGRAADPLRPGDNPPLPSLISEAAEEWRSRTNGLVQIVPRDPAGTPITSSSRTTTRVTQAGWGTRRRAGRLPVARSQKPQRSTKSPRHRPLHEHNRRDARLNVQVDKDAMQKGASEQFFGR